MDAFLKGLDDVVSFVRNAWTPVLNSRQAPKPESTAVMLAGQEIERAISMIIEKGRGQDAVGICEAIYTNAIKGRESDIENIKNKLFEAGLEIALAGKNSIAKAIMFMLFGDDTPPHLEAIACWPALGSDTTALQSQRMITALEKAVSEKEYLTCIPHFLGKVYEQGLYGVTQDHEKAKEYFQIAAKRGYETRDLKKQREEYKLMLEAQQTNQSVFPMFLGN